MSFWDGKRVLVTGASGFVGSALATDLLGRGAHVLALDVEPFRLPDDADVGDGELSERVIDVRNGAALTDVVQQFDVELAYHLAAESEVGEVEDDPVKGFESNVRGTWNLLEAARTASSVTDGVVVASSDKAYGPHEDLPYTEGSELKAVSPYSVSKMAADRIAYSYGTTYDLPVTIARCSNIYGPGDWNFSRIVPETIVECLAGNSPVIRSDGSPTRDYLYVDDAVSAYRTLGEQTTAHPGDAFNFGTGVQTTVFEVVDLIASEVGETELDPLVLDEADGEITHQYVDSSKARELLDWRPETTLEDGIAETVDWYRARFDGAESE